MPRERSGCSSAGRFAASALGPGAAQQPNPGGVRYWFQTDTPADDLSLVFKVRGARRGYVYRDDVLLAGGWIAETERATRSTPSATA